MGKTILVVDDHEPLRKAVKILLESKGKDLGYRVLEAANGLEALDLVVKEHPDLAIVDLMMPQVDGFTFCNEVKAQNDKIKIIIFTARTDMETKNKTVSQHQPDLFLTKPMDNQELFDAVTKLLNS